MIEEMQILREIFGDLSTVGIWAIVSYFAYKVLVIVAWLLALFGAYKISEKIFLSVKNSMSDKERQELLVDVVRYKEESERARHAYKLLSEKIKAQGLS